MTSRKDQVLESFEELCNEILAGTIDKEKMRIATRLMCDIGQAETMRKRFNEIGEIMEKRKK